MAGSREAGRWQGRGQASWAWGGVSVYPEASLRSLAGPAAFLNSKWHLAASQRG